MPNKRFQLTRQRVRYEERPFGAQLKRRTLAGQEQQLGVVLLALMCAAFLGLAASLAVHIASLLGVTLSGVDSMLFSGLFIVWIPTILLTNKLSADFPRKDLWKASLRGAPSWVGKAIYAAGIYALINFAWLWFAPKNALTEARGLSGHSMAFYAVASGVLFSAWRLRVANVDRLCAQGHVVPPSADFCPKCGSPVVNEVPRPAG